MNRLLISAAHKSSGKTTLSLGLCAALRARGQTVQPFKKGPDYIDPMWLTLASGRPCHNLDFYLMSHDEILSTFSAQCYAADLCLIEGNKGLYDGLDLDGSNSNAALAELTRTPVVLVIDARGMTRGIAPLILGYQGFDANIRIGGVILNRLGGSRHESKLRAVIEHYTDVPVLGAVHHDEQLNILERHLGLVPSNEASEASDKIDIIAKRISAQVDLDRVLTVAASAGALPTSTPSSPLSAVAKGPGDIIRIGIARDAAFAFYYPDDLEALRAQGAELIPFDTLNDRELPDVDALFIGGGFPEVHMRSLEANRELRLAVRTAVEAGMPVYAECGGLMYLSRSLRWRDTRCEMVGALPADTVMEERPQGRGYVRLRPTAAAPWPGVDSTQEIRAHEFHYSRLENVDPRLPHAYEVLRGQGIDGKRDGLVYKNTLACYTHMRHVLGNPWTRHFVQFIRERRRDAHQREAVN